MNKEQKTAFIGELSELLEEANVFYLADTSALPADATTELRRSCFNNKVTLQVVKNTLLAKAMERLTDKNFGGLAETLSGPTSIMTAEAGNAPAKVIKAFRKKYNKPILKGAYIEESVYIGDENLEALVSIKSKEELIGDVIALLQSPAKNVVSALQSGGNTLAGLVKTLSEKAP